MDRRNFCGLLIQFLALGRRAGVEENVGVVSGESEDTPAEPPHEPEPALPETVKLLEAGSVIP